MLPTKENTLTQLKLCLKDKFRTIHDLEQTDNEEIREVYNLRLTLLDSAINQACSYLKISAEDLFKLIKEESGK